MIEEKDIKLYHDTNLNREVLLKGNKLNENLNPFNSSLKPTKNISRDQENQFVHSNPNNSYYRIPSNIRVLKKNEKYKFGYNNIINIDKNKLNTYFLCNNYEKIFSLFELYIVNLFNGLSLESIINLYKNELITDSVYINVMKCIDLINESKKKYNHILLRNNNNRLDTTEIFIKLEENASLNLNIKDYALMLVLKFMDLLKFVDENLFSDDIDKLKQVFEKNNY